MLTFALYKTQFNPFLTFLLFVFSVLERVKNVTTTQNLCIRMNTLQYVEGSLPGLLMVATLVTVN